MKDKIKIGFIGLGERGKAMLELVFAPMIKRDVEILAVCDEYEDRAKIAAEFLEKETGTAPFCTTDYKEVVSIPELDAVVIMTAWEAHIPIAIAAMKAGKYVGLEVGGAYSIEDCWELVRTSEETGMPCMMLENCCYGHREMMLLNMIKKGVLGDIVHCTGGYCHDLREEIAAGEIKRHYRFRNYMHRNCDNYPTHALGPIAKTIGINRGNQFLSVASFASCSKGLNQYFAEHSDRFAKYINLPIAQADVVTTVITCAGGQTITLMLNTTTPLVYSRCLSFRGTKGMYFEDNDSLYFEEEHNAHRDNWKPQWGNALGYEEKYDHPIWQEYNGMEQQGHGGMDWLVCRAFVESVKRGIQPPIDVYDAAAWMSISALSEASIATGGSPVPAHDFTRGKWMNRETPAMNKYTLDEVVEDKTITIL